MKIAISLLAFLFLSNFTFAQTDTLVVNNQLIISNDTTVAFVHVTSTGILIADGMITVTGDMTIDSGGVVTHTDRDTSGLRLNVTGTLEIKAGGKIDVSTKGLRGGNNGSLFGFNGETFDENDNIVSAGNYLTYIDVNGGGSYGGWAGHHELGNTNNPYGLLENPRHLGSGGGGVYELGGHGGGRIRITAGNCIVNGMIAANGGNVPWGRGAGGSGGAIKIGVGNLSGNGKIQSLGGNAPANMGMQGAGSGGRIAIYYTTNTFLTDSIRAYGGYTGAKAAAGTIYLKDNGQLYGNFIIENNNTYSSKKTPLRTALGTFQNIILKNSGYLQPIATDISTFTVVQQVLLTNNSEFWLSNGVTMNISNTNGFDINVESGSLLLLDTTSVLNANALRMNGGILTTYIDRSYPVGTDIELSGGGTINVLNNRTLSVNVFDGTNFQSGTVNIPTGSTLSVTSNNITVTNGLTLIKSGYFGASDNINNLTIDAGGVVTHTDRDTSGLRLNVNGTLEIKAGGKIDVSTKGLRGGNNGSLFGFNGETFDENDNIVSAGNYLIYIDVNGGGSYGGWAGHHELGNTNNPYGLLENPRHLGSGGGGVYELGGHGGGRIRITAGNCIVNGMIAANGGNVPWGRGAGGSGGAIKIGVGNLSGNGKIQSLGGNAPANMGIQGAGSGGRIAIYYTTNTFLTDSIRAYGGYTGAKASAGTIYLKDNGQLYGNFIIENNNTYSSKKTPLRTALGTFQNIILKNRGYLQPIATDISAFTVVQQVLLTNYSELTLNNDIEITVANITDFDFEILNGSVLILDITTTVNANSIHLQNQSQLIHRSNILLSNIDSIFIENNSKLILPDTLTFDHGIAVMQDGIIESMGAINLQNAKIKGTGSINARLFNSGEVSPGNPVGRLLINEYTQLADGVLNIELGGTNPGSGYDVLDINTEAILSGVLNISYVNGFTPTLNDRFDIITYNQRTGNFSNINGWNSYGYNYFLDRFTLIAGFSSAINSSCDPFIILSPSGFPGFHVTLRDNSGNPIANSNDVWLEFTSGGNLTPCTSEINWPIVNPLGVSDSVGKIMINPHVGGYNDNLVKVVCSQGIIASIPLKTLDHNAGLVVSAGDFVGDMYNDYNNDGVTNGNDFNFLTNYLGQNCIESLECYLFFDSYTIPPVDNVFIGDTILICGKVVNTLNEVIVVDSINFSFSGFGIAMSWIKFAQYQNILINPLDSIKFCAPFFVNTVQHGCWLVTVYSRLQTDYNKQQTTASNQEQINSRTKCRKGTENTYRDKNYNKLCLSGDLDADGICDDDESQGCINPEDKCRPLDQIQGNPNLPGYGCPRQNNSDSNTDMIVTPQNSLVDHSTSIPIGTSHGDSLYIYPFAFLPNGWSFSVSEYGWVHTPDTIIVTIFHDPIIDCGDTGKVILYAYNSNEQLAGNAEFSMHGIGIKCDLNFNDVIDVADLQYIISYLYEFGPEPFAFETAEITNDKRIDIADVCRLVDYLYLSHTPVICGIDTGYIGPEIRMNATFANDTTKIEINSPITLRGIECILLGDSGAIPVLLNIDNLDLIYGQLNDSLRIGLVDTNGGAMISAGIHKLIKIRGNYTLLLARAADEQFHSLPVVIGPFSAVSVLNGWNMVSVPGINSGGQGVNIWWPFRDPGANVFKYSGGYQSVTEVVPGTGYWMKHLGDRVYNYSDVQIVAHDPLTAASGWNLFGGYELSVTVANVTTNPPGLRTGPIYKYSGGYQVATTLDPGYGYWIKLTGAGQIIIPETLTKDGKPVEYFPEKWGKIVLTDATGINYTLYAVKGQVDLSQYELPPAPMAGMFDIRFSSGRIAEDLNSAIKTIDMSGVTYPLIVRAEGMDIRLMDESGKIVNVNLKDGEDVVIDNSTINKLMVSGELVPTVYSLEQNYPNPFNPTTTFRYGLPEVSYVTMKVYDILGQEIKTLVNEEQSAGYKSVMWDSRNEYGSQVASGVYLYRIDAKAVRNTSVSFIAVKKMILLK